MNKLASTNHWTILGREIISKLEDSSEEIFQNATGRVEAKNIRYKDQHVWGVPEEYERDYGEIINSQIHCDWAFTKIN